jgi:hypothetical protein
MHVDFAPKDWTEFLRDIACYDRRPHLDHHLAARPLELGRQSSVVGPNAGVTTIIAAGDVK